LAVIKEERRTVRGKTVGFVHLGKQRVEFLTARHDSELRKELRRSCSKSRYHTGKAQESPRRTLVCHLMPTKVKSFQQLVDKIVHLIVSKIEAHEKAKARGKTITKTVKSAVKRAVKTSRKSSDDRVSMKGHHYRALPT